MVGYDWNSKNKDGSKHFTSLECIDKYSLNYWQDYFTFVCVRNPWTRMISHWTFICRVAINVKNIFLTFDNFVRQCCLKEHVYMIGNPLRTYKEYLTDKDGNIIVDHIIKFEHLNEEFELIKNKFNLDGKLEWIFDGKNKYDKNVDNWYTQELRELVAMKYKWSIEKFNYKYPGNI